MNSLENMLEAAYAKVAQDNEPSLQGVSVHLASNILNQPPKVDAEEGENAAQLPVPYVLLRANRKEESIPHTGIFETELTIEAGDNAQAGSKDGSLDSLFHAAARPLFYQTITDAAIPPVTRTLFQALSNAVSSGFVCFGMPQRATGTTMENEGSVVKRMISATFHCRSVETA